jgi:hypothetical protein
MHGGVINGGTVSHRSSCLLVSARPLGGSSRRGSDLMLIHHAMSLSLMHSFTLRVVAMGAVRQGSHAMTPRPPGSVGEA